jgi:hypothetical protein
MKGIMAALALVWCVSGVFGEEAVIREISGTVETRAGGAAEWSPARPGQRVGRDTVISTGFKSNALIMIGNSTVAVRPLTRLSVEELTAGDGREQVRIGLRTGRIRAEVKAPSGGEIEFTVRSPTATASVRGTAFEFDGNRLQVAEGRVHLTGNVGGGVYVGTGHEGRIEPATGRMVGPGETAREEVMVSLPAGVSGAPEIVRTAPPAPGDGDVEAGFEWN